MQHKSRGKIWNQIHSTLANSSSAEIFLANLLQMFRSATDLRFHGCWHGQDNKVLLSTQHSPLLPSFHLFPCVKRKKVILSEKFYFLLLFTSNNHRSAWGKTKCVSQLKKVAKAWNDQASAITNTCKMLWNLRDWKKTNNTYAFC